MLHIPRPCNLRRSGVGTAEYHFKGNLLLDFERSLGVIAASLPLAQIRSLCLHPAIAMLSSVLTSERAISGQHRHHFLEKWDTGDVPRMEVDPAASIYDNPY